MAKGKLRMLFPGGNTCLGFYSFYDQIIGPDANRIFIIKGGPGVGKSTFMKKIGEELREEGYDIEFHWCSSDNDSLDAVTIPAIGVALIDGTAPHVVDPRNPGAVDEIINLGEFWDMDALAGHRREIITVNQTVGRHFATAYSSLRIAKLAREEASGCRRSALSDRKLNTLLRDITWAIFGDKLCWLDRKPEGRHLFASALTPLGITHHLPTLLDGIKRLYLLEGEAGSGSEEVINGLALYAARSGLKVEFYHCAFDPSQIDLLLIPELSTAVLKSFPQLNFQPETLPQLVKIEEYDCRHCLEPDRLSACQRQLREAESIFVQLLERALAYIKLAKEVHDQMEQYYVQAMNFPQVEEKRKETLARIRDYAE